MTIVHVFVTRSAHCVHLDSTPNLNCGCRFFWLNRDFNHQDYHPQQAYKMESNA